MVAREKARGPVWVPATTHAQSLLGTRAWRLPPVLNRVAVETGIGVEMRDGTVLRTDHYGPAGAGTDAHRFGDDSADPATPALGRPTVLMRTPYPRGGLSLPFLILPFACRGYHVVVQSCRGMFGSGGDWAPMLHETDDAHDTVTWLRAQPWFDGRLVTYGASYLGYVQWALAGHMPPELKAMSVQFAPHSGPELAVGRGPLALTSLLVWSDQLADQERLHPVRAVWRTRQAERRLAESFTRLPLTRLPEGLTGGAPWWADWMDHAEVADPYWELADQSPVLETTTVPTLLFGGWHDAFLPQTLRQYERLRARDVDVALRIGNWSHMDTPAATGRVMRESLAWFDAHLDRRLPAKQRSRVRVFVPGSERWELFDDWPPRAAPRRWYLAGERRLLAAPRTASHVDWFRYDPNDPTPAVGGAVIAHSAGQADNGALEARTDVLTYTGAPLPEPLTIAGAIDVRLQVRTQHQFADVFVRVCDVTPEGRSLNVTDELQRLDSLAWVDAGEARTVTIRLPDTAYTFGTGHRLRLQVSGGAFPRFARNLGYGEPPATGVRMRGCRIGIDVLGSHVTLPSTHTPVADDSG